MKAQKTNPNRALKVAIVATGKTSRAIAMSAGIAEGQFSKIVTGRVAATEHEIDKIVAALKRFGFDGSKSEIFPADRAVA